VVPLPAFPSFFYAQLRTLFVSPFFSRTFSSRFAYRPLSQPAFPPRRRISNNLYTRSRNNPASADAFAPPPLIRACFLVFFLSHSLRYSFYDTEKGRNADPHLLKTRRPRHRSSTPFLKPRWEMINLGPSFHLLLGQTSDSSHVASLKKYVSVGLQCQVLVSRNGTSSPSPIPLPAVPAPPPLVASV